MRKNEFESVLESYKHMGLNVKGVDAKERSMQPWQVLKIRRRNVKPLAMFLLKYSIQRHNSVKDVKWLAQGTIYPDVIESVSVKGPSMTIKSHHNVGGLPDYMKLKIVEPLRSFFKDEVRRVGKALNIDDNILGRHPFPGPGLAIRILGDITADKVKLLQEADAIFIDNLKSAGCMIRYGRQVPYCCRCVR